MRPQGASKEPKARIVAPSNSHEVEYGIQRDMTVVVESRIAEVRKGGISFELHDLATATAFL